jgi:small subunit ribosomal protein S6
MSIGRSVFVRSYECAIVFYPTLGDDGVKTGLSKYLGVVDSQGGELTRVESWGKRKLAYEIDHQSEGYYYFVKFRGSNELLKELGRQLRIDESVLRHLVVKDELAKGDEPKTELASLEVVETGPKEGFSRGETSEKKR